MLGGRTHHWGRISLRFGPDDFRGKSIDGYGDDWPITYDDMKPYYDKADEFIGIFGSNHAARDRAAQRARRHVPAAAEAARARAPHQEGVRLAEDSRRALAPVDHHAEHNGRAACHYCGQCGRGCATHSNFSSVSVMLPPALKTGRLTIVANAMAREVMTDAERPRHRRVVHRHREADRTPGAREDRGASPRAAASRRA